MKICVFADIHGNGHAFREALPMMKDEGADLYLYLGDLCGYYFEQLEVLEGMLALPNLVALRGNHDQAFLAICNGDSVLRQDYLKRYGPSMEFLLDRDCKNLVHWLSGLPGCRLELEGQITAAHGSPWDPVGGYVYPNTPLNSFLAEPANLFCLGHTHYPMSERIGDKLIVNPGSLGQPRNGRWPTYALIEQSICSVEFREVPYAKDVLRQEIAGRVLGHPYLTEVLFR